MKVRELIIKLLECPMDYDIGVSVAKTKDGNRSIYVADRRSIEIQLPEQIGDHTIFIDGEIFEMAVRSGQEKQASLIFR